MVSFKALIVAYAALLCHASASPVQPVQQVNGTTNSIPQGSPTDGRYIVCLKSDIKSKDFNAHLQWVDHVHKRSLNADQFNGIESTEIEKNPEVGMVELDRVWNVSFIEELGDDGTMTLQKRALTTQRGAPWGLGTISHRQPESTDYIYDTNAGRNTYAYIIDTGLRASHSEFEGRARMVYNAFMDSDTDTVGHGTHVAGIIGGKTFGVAKQARLLGIKVFQGQQTSTSTILQGFNWAANDIVRRRRTNSAVINMSLGGPFSAIFNNAVESASRYGVVSVVAAGNNRLDASRVSPASAASAITVGALNRNWTMAGYSNFGSTLDIFAPGTSIQSAWFRNDNDVNVISGTSMAAPHVAGLALTAMSVDGARGVNGITSRIRASGTRNGIKGDTKGSVNLIANNNNPQQ